MYKALGVFARCCIFAGALSACATQDGVAQTSAPGAKTSSPTKAVANTAAAANELRLRELLEKRLSDKSDPDYALGPGDVLEVSVQDVPELRNRRTRVTGDNTISLPILGTIDVAGLNEEGVKKRVYRRASQYVHDPEVEVFVREYHSRDVMVMGMVQKPGMYPLDSPNETVLDVIGEAGGSTERAASQVILVPSGITAGAADEMAGHQPGISMVSAQEEEGRAPAMGTQPGVLGRAAADGPVKPVSPDVTEHLDERAPAGSNRSQWIVLDTSGSGDPAIMSLPARPGDLIMVPAAGEVMVQGWVRSPGAFVITPQMTALGAITAAGGEMFSSSADLLRDGSDAEQADYQLNLDKIEKRQEEDVLVQSGDVIIVNKSATGAVPYFFYSLFNRLSSGVYATPF